MVTKTPVASDSRATRGFSSSFKYLRVRGDNQHSSSGVRNAQLGNAFTEGLEPAVIIERVGIGPSDLIGDRRFLCVQLVERHLAGSKG